MNNYKYGKCFTLLLGVTDETKLVPAMTARVMRALSHLSEMNHNLKVRNLNDSLTEQSRLNSRQNECLTNLTTALQSKHGGLMNTFRLFSQFQIRPSSKKPKLT
ncbi:hypothetical protein AND4_08747 [Vibrio sp. AND4]|nr:hypothetical protein AND4_08747 [Vibrio sp. AND4]